MTVIVVLSALPKGLFVGKLSIQIMYRILNQINKTKKKSFKKRVVSNNPLYLAELPFWSALRTSDFIDHIRQIWQVRFN